MLSAGYIRKPLRLALLALLILAGANVAAATEMPSRSSSATAGLVADPGPLVPQDGESGSDACKRRKRDPRLEVVELCAIASPGMPDSPAAVPVAEVAFPGEVSAGVRPDASHAACLPQQPAGLSDRLQLTLQLGQAP